MSAATLIPVPSDQLRSMADYVRETQPIIEKQGKLETALAARATGVVDTLVRNGCLHAHLKEAKVREFTSEPATLLDEVEKLASRVQVAPVGGPVEHIKEASTGDTKGSANQVFLNTLTEAGN